MTKPGALAAILCPLALAACATMVRGTVQNVTVSTTPKSNAKCVIENEKGSWNIASTPGIATVTRARSPLKISCTHPDGDNGTISVASLALATAMGSFAAGGLISVDFDRRTGALYSYPKDINVQLLPGPSIGADTTVLPSPATEATSESATTPPSRIAAERTTPGALRKATEYCQKIDQDPRLDPLRDIIALDGPPSLAMQSNPAHLTPDQKRALDAWQPLYSACRNELMATGPEIARLFDKAGVRNPDFLNLYQGKTTIGDFNRARAREFEVLKMESAKLAAARAETPTAVPQQPQPPRHVERPIDYCPGMNELVCVDHQHGI